MSFGAPIYLLMIPLVGGLLGLLLLWSERARRDALGRLGNPALVARLTAGSNPRRRWARALLAGGGALLLLFALARPQWGQEVRMVQREGLQVVVALDVSTSMLADDLKPNRLARAKLEIADLMERLDGDELALVLFSGASFVQFPLTSDYNTARQFLQGAAPGAISQPGTNVGDAIATTLGAFDENSGAQKVLVIVTDGEAHDADALTQAQAAADAGVRIFTVGMGSPDGAPVPQLDAFGNVVGQKIGTDGAPVVTRLDEATLQQIAEIGGGSYALATPGGEHLDALQAALDSMQEGEFGEQTDVRRIERFQPFAALALLLLAAATLLPVSTRKSVEAPVPAAPRKRVVQAVRRDAGAAVRTPRPQPEPSAAAVQPALAYAPPAGMAPAVPVAPAAPAPPAPATSGTAAPRAWG